MIAKSLVQDPSIVIFDEPTRGVDVGTIPEIHAQIRRARRRRQGDGGDLLLSAGDARRLRPHPGARLGRIVAEFDGATATEDKIMYAAIH